MNDDGKKLDKTTRSLSSSIEKKVADINRNVQNRVDAISNRIRSRLGSEPSINGADPYSEDLHSSPQQNSHHAFAASGLGNRHAKVNVYDVLRVEIVDDLFNSTFHIDANFRGEDLRYPTYYCETLEEFFEPFVKDMDLSGPSKQKIISYLIEEAQKNAHMGGTFGVNFPGDGCYLNGWLLSYPNTEDPARALKDPEKIPIILEVLAHEKLGHGFLSEYTTLGNEMQNIQLARYDIADDFNIKQSDSPRSILLKEKWECLFQHFLYAEEGYATWIENFILTETLGTNKKGYEASEVKKALAEIDRLGDLNTENSFGLSLSAAYDVFLTPGQHIETIHRATLLFEAVESLMPTSKAWHFRQTPRYVIGSTVIQQIENNFGKELVPYVMAIAYNVTYELESISNADLERILLREPLMNIHSRLLNIMSLDGDSIGSVQNLARACNSTLNMAIPSNLNL